MVLVNSKKSLDTTIRTGSSSRCYSKDGQWTTRSSELGFDFDGRWLARQSMSSGVDAF
jgi:hypothetical protein